jgi:hypothetical protein
LCRFDFDKVLGNIKVVERFFDLPLDYAEPDGQKIRVFARNLIPKDKAKTPEDEAKLPYCKYSSSLHGVKPTDRPFISRLSARLIDICTLSDRFAQTEA